MIKQHLTALVQQALSNAQAKGLLPDSEQLTGIQPVFEVPKQKSHGDFATTVALSLAPKLSKPERKVNPREIAQAIADHLPKSDDVEKIEIAGPGFINFYLRPTWLQETVRDIANLKDKFGKTDVHKGKRVQVEFVSANPNGPITVAHGRGGAIGDAVASLLDAVGYSVEREFYINDALNSTQMNNFGRSVHMRYMQALGVDMGQDDEVNAPDWLYRGDYVRDIAQDIILAHGEKFKSLNINNSETVQIFRELAAEGMREEQEADLAAFGVTFDSWFSEATLHESGAVQRAIDELSVKGFTYEHDGALWLKSTEFGDDKDRVLLRADGTATYIAGDVAYHKDKFQRGFDELIDVWGADHGGYVARTKASIAATGNDPSKLTVILFQLVSIVKNGELVRSSKRRGNILELKADLIDEIGKDATRFYFLMRSSDTTQDIDIDLAKEQSSKNPVFYVQYAHARCCRILEKAAEQGVADFADADLSLIEKLHEIDLMKRLSDYPDQVAYAALNYAPHTITTYLRELAATFHLFYDAGNNNPALRVISDDPAESKARLFLVDTTRIVLKNALSLLGLSSPTSM